MRKGAGVVALLFAAVAAGALAESVAPDATWSGPFGIEVRVEDHRGRDLEGAEVTLAWLDGVRGGPPPSRSGADGRVRFTGLAPGRWELVARRDGQMTYVAEIVVTADRPQVITARHENVRGAISPMRLRVTRGPTQLAAIAPSAGPRAATPAASDRRRVEEAPPVRPASPPTPASQVPTAPSPAPPAPAAPSPTPLASAAPSPAPPISAAPGPAPAAPAPRIPAAPVLTPAAPAPAVDPTPAPAAPPAATAVDRPSAAPAATPTPPIGPAVAPAALPEPTPPPVAAPVAPQPPAVAPRQVEPPLLRRHADRTCPECPAGEASLSIDLVVDSSSTTPGCPAEAVAAFAGLPAGEWTGGAAALPPACAALLLDLPERARFTGYRYEAAAEGRYEDCPAGRDCPGLSCSWAGDPLVVRVGGTTRLAALFGNRAERPRRARFTAYFKEGRR